MLKATAIATAETGGESSNHYGLKDLYTGVRNYSFECLGKLDVIGFVILIYRRLIEVKELFF